MELINENGKCLIIATPIGNMNDVSNLTIEAIKKCDYLFCEDTRRTQKIIDHFSIKSVRYITYREDNERNRAGLGLKYLLEGKIIGIISDGGIPLISDPGYRLVSLAVANNIEIEIIPGPSAFLYGLIKSGIGPDNFWFVGFFPKKLKKIDEIVSIIKEHKITLIFYESPYRIKKTLNILKNKFENADIAVCRELTKKYEEIIRGKIENLSFDDLVEKGEFTVILRSRK